MLNDFLKLLKINLGSLNKLPVPKLNATALVKLRMCVNGLNTVFATCANPFGMAKSSTCINYFSLNLLMVIVSANLIASSNSFDVNLPLSGFVYTCSPNSDDICIPFLEEV